MSEFWVLQGYVSIHHWRATAKWELRFVLCSDTKSLKPKYQTKTKVLYAPGKGEREVGNRSYPLWRSEILRLIATVDECAPSHEALMIEEPCLMGFRAKECTTLRIEHVNLQLSICQVLDAKKHCLLPVPWSPLCTKHFEKCAHGRSEGLVIENHSTAWRTRIDQPISTVAVFLVWKKWCKRINIYPSYQYYSPIVGRRVYAAEIARGDKDNPVESIEDLVERLVHLQRWMRHTHFEQTMRYVRQNYFAEDEKRVYDRYSERMMREIAKVKEATTPHIQDFKQMEMKAKA